MDDYQGSMEELDIVLKDINRVNTILGGYAITLNAVFQLLEDNPQESYTILDMGCAEGTILRKVALAARKRNIKLMLVGVDLNEDAIELARTYSTDFPEIRYLNQDVLTADFSTTEIDVVMTTLTMHHFSTPQILEFALRFNALAKLGVVINDLQRSRVAYVLFQLFSLFFINSEIAKTDGLISIRRALTKKEIKGLAAQVPQVEHSVSWKWAFRYLWVMKRKSEY
ncbi:MAG: methyltransferase domain-containing protein [Maribacter sp.]